MKRKKTKPRGIKHKIREERKREERISLVATVAILITIILVSAFFANSLLNQPSSSQPSTSQPVSSISEPKAAIVDHLSLTYPNQTFVQTATDILKQAEYSVDYYPGEEVTVEFYRNLPTHSYGIIILRVHSATTVDPSSLFSISIYLFTSEPYDQTKHVDEQLTSRLIIAAYSEQEREKGLWYFGISSSFVRESMNGRFQNTAVIMMGCKGLAHTEMASAFVERGAKVYMGWTGPVSASHTDQAATHLLQHLVAEKQTINRAVANTMKEVGADPTCESKLVYSPSEAGDYVIQNIVGTQVIVSTSMGSWLKKEVSEHG